VPLAALVPPPQVVDRIDADRRDDRDAAERVE
jgi:hypothetical protein